MATISPLAFEAGPPKKISLTYTLGTNEEIYMAFLQDLATGTGEGMLIDNINKVASVEYDWQPGCQYRAYVTFTLDLRQPGTAPGLGGGEPAALKPRGDEAGPGDAGPARKGKKG